MTRPVNVGRFDASDDGVGFQVFPNGDVAPKGIMLWAVTKRLERFRLVRYDLMTRHLNLL